MYLLCLTLNVGLVVSKGKGIHHALRKEMNFVLVGAMNHYHPTVNIILKPPQNVPENFTLYCPHQTSEQY